jgi:anti-sigma B factor antagonist
VTELSIMVDAHAGGTVVVARGRILYDTVAPLDRALKELMAGPKPQIVLDLHEVVLCDSSGLQLLIDTQRHARAAGGWLRLCRPQPIVERVLEITNLTDLLPAYGSVDAAVSAPDASGSGRASSTTPPTENG